MAFSKVKTCALVGLEPKEVTVECDISSGLPAFKIVGLGDKAIDEAKERVRSALKNSGFKMPNKRITINLSPADLHKAGTAYDLPIAVALLAASKQIELPDEKIFFYGEMSLNGELKSTPGTLLALMFADQRGFDRSYVPEENSYEAELLKEPPTFLASDLAKLSHHLLGEVDLKEAIYQEISGRELAEHPIDFRDILGQSQAKRAMEIVAAGGHNILLIGAPGSGKTMLAKALPSILPPMTHREVLDVTKIYSGAGKLKEDIKYTRPFREPHHTSSSTSVVGGGSWPEPGEVTLAHLGVLFLDEFLEFPRDVLEALREPLESGEIQISRSRATVEFPAEFMLVAAANPCPCGFLHDEEKHCSCTASEIKRYQKKLSGPLLDRIDLQVQVPRISYEKSQSKSKSAEKSNDIRERVMRARERQEERFKEHAPDLNAEMNSKQIKKICEMEDKAHKLLKKSADKLMLSIRGVHKVIKVARTIADLNNHQEINASDVAEALQYRLTDLSKR